MEDKQIIIDNVDVSGCECFSKYGNSCGLMRPFGFCSQWSNCYYKQLKRKEQECEFSNLRIIQLQETLSQYETDLSTKDCIVETCKAQYKELKAENEHLSEKEEEAKHYLEEAKKFKNCLTEIKEIVFPENQLIITDSPIILKIQEKISEVENE